MPPPEEGSALRRRDPAHQRLMLANMAATCSRPEAIVTTVAKAKVLRPYAEHLITKAKKGGVHQQRQVDRDASTTRTSRTSCSPRSGRATRDRSGGYLRILKLGPRPGDNAPMARIELV